MSTPFSAKKNTGFTLLEVLLALAILAIAGMAVLSMVSGIVKETPILEQRLLANLVADNLMVALRLDKKRLSESWKQDKQELAHKEWPVRFRRLKTALDGFQAIEVEVRAPGDDDGALLASLISYVDMR